jgi:hypothetical protein
MDWPSHPRRTLIGRCNEKGASPKGRRPARSLAAEQPIQRRRAVRSEKIGRSFRGSDRFGATDSRYCRISGSAITNVSFRIARTVIALSCRAGIAWPNSQSLRARIERNPNVVTRRRWYINCTVRTLPNIWAKVYTDRSSMALAERTAAMFEIERTGAMI